MEMYLTKEFSFDAAHNLVNTESKCRELHGHTYRLRVTIKGEPEPTTGMIMDFSKIKEIVNQEIIQHLDHKYLNEIVEISTAENIIQWIWNQLGHKLTTERAQLAELTLWETATSFVTIRGSN